MKKILGIIILGLFLGSCANMDTSHFKKQIDENGGYVQMHFLAASMNKAIVMADQQCRRFNPESHSQNVRLYHKGSLADWSELSFYHYDCKKILTAKEKELIEKREEEKRIAAANLKKEEEKRLMVELENNYGKECEGSLIKKGFKKGSNEYYNCLIAKKADLEKKQKELEIKLAAMQPKERHAYNCSETFKFRKGTEKFNDCVFKLYTAELDLQKLELEKQVAEAQIKAAATEQARAEAVAQAQIASAKAARRSSDLNNSIQLMKLGSSLLGGSSSTSSSSNSFDINNRTRTTCRVVGGFLNCY